MATVLVAQQASSTAQSIPSTPLSYGFLSATFGADGTFTIAGQGWPKLAGTFKTANGEIEVALATPMNGCAENGKYRYAVDGKRVTFELVTDTCQVRRMMLGGSSWLPEGEKPPIPERRIVRTPAPTRTRAAGCRSSDKAAGRHFAASKPLALPMARTCPTRGTWNAARTSSGRRRFQGSRTRVRSSGATRSSSRLRSAASRMRRSSPDSTATAMRPTIDRASSGS